MTIEKDKSRVLGGLRATVENPLTSQEAKDKARAKIEALENEEGNDKIIEPGQRLINVGDPAKGEGQTSLPEDQHANRSIGAMKATMANPRTSEQAKAQALAGIVQSGSQADIEHAQRDLGAPSDERPTGEKAYAEQRNRAIGSAKGILHRSNVSDEAKQRAREQLEEAGVDPDSV